MICLFNVLDVIMLLFYVLYLLYGVLSGAYK